MRLAGKVAIVTGGASGFGAEIARTYLREGAKVAVLDLNQDAAKATVAHAGKDATAIRCDVTSQSEVDAAVKQIVNDFERVDILVNNAGWTYANKPLLDVSEHEFDKVFNINVKSIFVTSRAVIPFMAGQNAGVIVNIGSAASLRPPPGLAWYCATKGAVNVVSKSMALELARHGIRVNCVAPGLGESALLESFMGAPDTQDNRSKFETMNPLGRIAKATDVANACLYLATDECAYVNGVILPVDGGRSA